MNIELFPCSGGMALGFRRAGIEFDLAIDFDPCAVDSYAANLGHRPLQMDVRDFLRLLEDGWRPAKRLELLVADPPCTPWSRAGKCKGQDDERDMLGETMQIIELLMPQRWVIANVPGLDDATHWDKVVKPVIGEAAVRLGYCVDYASLNAANYGVPQMRVRPFWFAHQVGTECIRWPAPTHGDPRKMGSLSLPGVDALLPWVTCRDALSHLPLEELGKPVRLRWRNPDHRASDPDEPAKTQTRNTNSDGCLLVNPRHAPAVLDRPAPAVTAKDRDGHAAPATILAVGDGPRAMMRPHETDRPARTLTGSCQDSTHILAVSPRHVSREDEPAHGITAGADHRQESVLAESRQVGQWPSKGNHNPSRADAPALVQTSATGSTSGVMAADDDWPWGRPATTVTGDKSGRIPPPGHHGKSYMSKGVKLSEKARLILQSFPEDWQLLSSTKTGRSSMLGQAMPPLLAQPVARSIVEHMAKPEGE
ncbi:hypothetical protein LCGC14_0678560 [marine sediment metagenome]|uniref:DNA (cytosine-5-)-methyltransferase n=1 Tax=marine sediment metagenome TaxID=412755 RepID=A0A0F9QU12_9ZZZZ